MSMINTSDTDKGDSNQEVTKPDKQQDAEYQSQLAEALRKDKEAAPIDFKMENKFLCQRKPKIESILKPPLKQVPALSHGASLLTTQKSHIYSEQVSKLPNKQLLDS